MHYLFELFIEASRHILKQVSEVTALWICKDQGMKAP